jgi:hypothetical protein
MWATALGVPRAAFSAERLPGCWWSTSVAAVLAFALIGGLFFITLYLQNVPGTGPAAAHARRHADHVCPARSPGAPRTASSSGRP